MASGRHDCSICMDTFKNPKLLSCHHSFCFKCLDDYTRVNLRNGRFDCPICRASVELPTSGVAGFQSNFYIEETDTSEKFYCDLCGPKSVASSRCLDCKENLCQSCCYGHERSKVSRHHKISDMGTLDSDMKGKIRQRIFCDQHAADEIRLFCRDCKVLICVICKVVNHEIHVTKLVDDAAAEIKKTLQTKLNECSEKLRRIDASRQRGDELDKCINDAESEELKAVEDQHSRLNKVLDQEVAKIKARIKYIYHDLKQQNAVFVRDMEDEFKTCSGAKDNVQTLVDRGTDIDIIKKGPDLEQLVSAVISKADKMPNTCLEKKLFLTAEIKLNELISLVGMMQDSTQLRPEELDKSLREEREKLDREEKQIQKWSQRMEARVKTLEEELSSTGKQYEEARADTHRMETRVMALEDKLSETRKLYEEAKADAITKGVKLTQAEKEIETLRNQHSKAVAQAERYKKEIEVRDRKERAERAKKERDERKKKEREKKEREIKEKTEREGKEIKENCQRMEARVKVLEKQLSISRKQYEGARDDVTLKGMTLTQAEKEIQNLRNQISIVVAQVEGYEKETSKISPTSSASVQGTTWTGWLLTLCIALAAALFYKFFKATRNQN